MVSLNGNWLYWSLIFVAGVNSCIGNLLLKRSRLGTSDSSLVSLLLSPWFISGLVFYAINVVLFAKALDKLPVSLAYPVLAGVGFALITLTANWFFGERLGISQYLGLGMIIVGIIFMAKQ